jgi:hypothetical protein
MLQRYILLCLCYEKCLANYETFWEHNKLACFMSLILSVKVESTTGRMSHTRACTIKLFMTVIVAAS